MRVSVVIPTFNNWTLTERCIATLRRTTPAELLADVIVVDDASTDGESARWTAAQPDITPLLLTRNSGFSGACNAGAAVSHGDAILFLNNDAFARAGSLQTMCDTLATDPSVGIVGARLLYSDGTLQHAGLALLSGDVSRWWHIHKRRDGSLPDANVARDLLAVTGAALLVRQALFMQLGGFDEGFVNGWEDVDLCLRAWCAGARVRYEPRAVLEHLESATLGRNHNHERNERRFVERWQSALSPAPRYPLPEVPPIALAVERTEIVDLDDAWALRHVRRWWKAHLGAAVLRTRPGSRIDRTRVDLSAVVARRQPTLEIAWGDACLAPATGPQRVAFVAPHSAAQAQRYARTRVITQWWTPTETAQAALIAAGCAPSDVHVVRLGTDTSAPAPRSGVPVVAARECDSAILERLGRWLPAARTVVLRAGTAPPAGVDILVATGNADRWGLTLPAALGLGCGIVASPPVDGLIAALPGVCVVDHDALGDALIDRLGAIDVVRSGAYGGYLDARRRLDAYLATQHASELARAVSGGSPSAAVVEVGSALARHLGATRIDCPVHVA